MIFPEAVRKTRKQLGLTQAEFGIALHVSYATVNRWENGKHFPTPLVLEAIRAYCEKNGLIFPYQDNSDAQEES